MYVCMYVYMRIPLSHLKIKVNSLSDIHTQVRSVKQHIHTCGKCIYAYISPVHSKAIVSVWAGIKSVA